MAASFEQNSSNKIKQNTLMNAKITEFFGNLCLYIKIH